MAKKGGNPQTLKPFKKGYDPRRQKRSSPNPIVTDIKNYIREKLAEETTAGSGVTKLEALTQRILVEANKGNIKAYEILMAYGHGKPSQSIDVTSGGEKIKINFLDAT